LVVQAGLARLPIRPYTDTEWDYLPHVLLTTKEEWRPIVMDQKCKEDEPWGDYYYSIKVINSLNLFDDFGNYRHCVVLQYTDFFQQNDVFIELADIIDQCVVYVHQTFFEEDLVYSMMRMNMKLTVAIIIILMYLFLSLRSPQNENQIMHPYK
jgi:hypothetical protein